MFPFLIDTHAHLNFPVYQDDLDQVIKDSINYGVKIIICVASNLSDSVNAIRIAREYPGIVYAAAGIHPHQTDPQNNQSPKDILKKLAGLAREKEVVAIGECGLDFSPAPPGEKDRSLEDQVSLFEQQIHLAKSLKLPLIVHSRQAFTETLEILAKESPRGVFHCYTGGKKNIDNVLKLGFYFGVDGNLTYDSGLNTVFSKIPLDKIILETDSPFLSPVPYRGQRNEPKNVKIIAEGLAQAKNTSLEEIVKTTTENSMTLFGLY